MLPLYFCCSQTDDLARMYRLFHRIPKGLEPVADIFKSHVESEGNKLVKEVSEDVESKKQERELFVCISILNIFVLLKFSATEVS